MRPGLLRGDGHTIWVLIRKNKDTIRFHPVGTEAPSPRFSVHAGALCFTHTSRPPFPQISAKPVQGNHIKFSYARNVSYYKLVIHHSRGDGTARSTHRLLQVRVRYGALANIVPEALSVAFEHSTAGTDWEGAVLQTEEIPHSAGTLGTVPFLWRRTRALHRSGTGTLYPEHGSGIKELSHGNTSYSQRS